MLIAEMKPRDYKVVLYNLQGEIVDEHTQQTFLTADQLIEQIAIALEDTSKCVEISKVEVFAV